MSKVKNKQIFWNMFFIVLFVLISLTAFFLLKEKPREINIFDFFLIALANLRLIRLLTYDKITKFIRDYLSTKETGPLKTMYELLICPWCTGVWTSIFLVFFYSLTPVAWFFILILAVSGLASFIQVFVESLRGKVSNSSIFK